VHKPLDLVDEIRKGEYELAGIPLMSGINASDLSNDDLRIILKARYEEAGIKDEDSEVDFNSLWGTMMRPGVAPRG
jgi:hypothetical protein